MNGNCHLVFGTSVGVASVLFLGADQTEAVALLSSCMLGSLFPDIDNPTSHIGKLTVPVSTIIGKLSAIFGKTNANHRGIFHDMGMYLIGLFLCWMYIPALRGFFFGALSHIFLDCFNPAGVPAFFGAWHIHLGHLKSGEKESVIFTWICTIVVIGVCVAFSFHLIDGFPQAKISPF